MDQKLQKNSTGKKAWMQRYRAKHRRFDYVPSTPALAAIELHKVLETVIAGVFDQQLLAGNKTISGNMNG